MWVPVTSSKETIEWAARNDIPITPGLGHPGLREDVISYYARSLAENGHRITTEHLIINATVYVADSKERAIKEAAPYILYFNQTLFSHGNVTDASPLTQAGGFIFFKVGEKATGHWLVAHLRAASL